ncbi:MAG: STAS domain-containing protein [Eggerthellaceae bacterium]|nr:STAS domain-containing protein [Eggerthellaceae bacterium]
MDLNLDIKTEGTKATIAAEGKLTVQTSPDLEAAINELGEQICDIDIDLKEVDYIASAGLRVLVATDKLVLSRGGTMRLLYPNDDVNEVFDMTGLSDVFTIERS